MKQDEINDKSYEVTILNSHPDGEALSFTLCNEELGTFIMDNCHCNGDPFFFPNVILCWNGNAKLMIDKEEKSIFAILAIHAKEQKKGTLSLRGLC